jgi:hypothetical protein
LLFIVFKLQVVLIKGKGKNPTPDNKYETMRVISIESVTNDNPPEPRSIPNPPETIGSWPKMIPKNHQSDNLYP